MQDSGQGAEGQLLGLGAPGRREQGTTRDSHPDPPSRAKAPPDPLQADSGTQAQRAGEPGFDSLSTGASSPGTRRTGAQAAQTHCRGSFRGPAVHRPRGGLPMACLPARGVLRPNPGPQQQLGPQRPGRRQQGGHRPGRPGQQASSGLRGLLPWLACVGGGSPRRRLAMCLRTSWDTGRDSEV